MGVVIVDDVPLLRRSLSKKEKGTQNSFPFNFYEGIATSRRNDASLATCSNGGFPHQNHARLAVARVRRYFNNECAVLRAGKEKNLNI